jgi:SagB-type dehydrogenase family enzyme
VTPFEYHDGTKHHVNRFARSLGYLDWAAQPALFRSFAGAPVFPLFPGAPAPRVSPAPVAYDDLFIPGGSPRLPVPTAIGDCLRASLGLSAWKSFRGSRWPLRVNPSSGNLHPTEAYVVSGPAAGLASTAGVYHYAPDRHALELRCSFDPGAWERAASGADWLVVLTSIHWREAWKYGERAFRYCQHDLGHAVAAVRLAAALDGRRARLVPEWPQPAIGSLVGLDRSADYVEAEPEEPGCLLVIGAAGDASAPSPELLDAVQAGNWTGRASQLSVDHVEWTFIDRVAEATRDSGRRRPQNPVVLSVPPAARESRALDARATLLQRRSALAFDAVTSLPRQAFVDLLGCTLPAAAAPWDALWWSARVHLAIFVHRVDGLEPGLYALPRRPGVREALETAWSRAFRWEAVEASLPLFLLAAGDCRRTARHVSCDQAIAADGCFSLGMIAELDDSLREFGPSFYRHLYWESGIVGQVLYLEAEAAGVRGTGIGCFYDDVMHDVLGIRDHRFQSLYHFAVGGPLEDARLTTEPGYGWEAMAPRGA